LSNRDDFTTTTIDLLARRVGFRCSNPLCQRPTIGANSSPRGVANIGVAAHITAAAPRGKRYDANLTKDERKDFANGIWLCQACAKLIDSDELKYSIDLLRNWKIEAENNASNSLENGLGYSSNQLDQIMLRSAGLFGQLGEMLSGDTEKTIEEMRNLWREGHREKTIAQLKSLKSDQRRWDILNNNVRAKVLRFEAGLVLDQENGLIQAKNLADQAYALDPSDKNQSKIRAIIARHEGHLDKAIEYMAGHSDVDGRNMLAALYLESGDHSSSRDVLASIDPLTANSETFRLSALLALFSKNIEQARFNIIEAEKLSPTWYFVRFNRAMIDFFSAISTTVIPTRPILWPEPISPEMVKQDEVSLTHLQNAIALFEELSKYENPGINSEIISNWKLASQLLSSPKQGNTSELVKSRLDSNPTDHYSIVWATALNYEFDSITCETATQTLLDSGKGTMFHVIALSELLIRRGAWKEAEEKLHQHIELFKINHAESVWQYWIVQVLGFQGKFDEANEFISRMDEDRNIDYAKGLILSIEAQNTGNNVPLINFLEEQYSKNKDPLFLLQACKIKFNQQDWRYIATRAEILINAYQTADVLWLAVVATFNAQDFRLCLDLIDKNQAMFGNELPGNVRRLKATCLGELGHLKAAISEMEALSLQSTQGLYQIADLYLHGGDLKKFSLIGRQLIEKPDLGSAEALQLARYLRQEDPELAKAMFRKADAEKLPSKQLGRLLTTAFGLGLDNETNQIHQVISRTNLEESDLTLFPIEELQNFMAQNYAEWQRVENLYRMGKIPVHMFAQSRNIDLIHLYHALLDFNEKEVDPFRKVLIFTRHGGKQLTHFSQSLGETQIYVDVTSILLAEHLNILTEIEGAFKSIFVANNLIISLIEMRDRLLPHQPSQINIGELLIDLVEQDKIHVIENSSFAELSSGLEDEIKVKTFTQNVKMNNGKILVFSQDPIRTSNSYSDLSFITAGNLLDTLSARGKLSAESVSETVEILGDEYLKKSDQHDLEIGTQLYCLHSTLGLFTNTDVLNTVCNSFDVHISRDYLNHLKQDLQITKSNEKTATWLSGLIERLRRGIQKEKYQLVAPPPQREASEAGKADRFQDLQALFAFSKTENAIIWCDDRHINAFSNRDGIPIIAINEILELVLTNQIIDKNQYFSLLNKLRDANLLFIPLYEDEISHFLLQAPIQDSHIQETHELKTLKSYAMRALGLGEFIQKPAAGQPNPEGEIYFLFQYVHACEDAIVNVWDSTHLTQNQKKTYSSWILDNLFVDYVSLSHISGIQIAQENREHLTVLRLMGLLSRGLSLPGKFNKNTNNKPSIRSQYFSWLNDRLFETEINFNPNVFTEALRLVKKIMIENKTENLEKLSTEILNLLYQDFCSDLPEAIRQLLEEDDDFMDSIGVKFIVNLGKYEFDVEDFWNSLEQASKTGRVNVVPQNVDYPIIMELHTSKNENAKITIIDPKDDGNLSINVTELELLNPRKSVQAAFLKQKRGLFDCSDQELTEISKKIMSESSPRKRVELFHRLQNRNLEKNYKELFNRVNSQKNLTIRELLPPSADDMVRFYRIKATNGKAFSSIWEAGARAILKDHSMAESLRRLWNIPVPLPEFVYSRFNKLDSGRQKKHIKTLLNGSQSPLSLIQITRFLLKVGADNRLYRRLGLQKLKYMLTGAYESEVKAFITALNWSARNIRIEESTAITQLLTIWTHAHNIYIILKAAGAPVDWIQEFFAKNMPVPRALFEDDRAIRYDVSFPHNITPQAMILSGITYCAKNQVEDLSEEYQLALANICFFKNGDRIFPHTMLLDDITTLTDQMESIFSGDRGEKLSGLLGPELSPILSTTNLQAIPRAILTNLDNRKLELAVWVELYSTTRGVSIPEEIKEQLVSSLINVDFAELFEKDIIVGRLAFQVTSMIAQTVNSDILARHITGQSRIIAKNLDLKYPVRTFYSLDDETKKGIHDAINVLLESALNISKMKTTPEERAVAFSQFSMEIAKSWAYFASRTRQLIQAMCEMLPTEQAQHVWRLLIYLRTIE
jgi:hypothetical protein